MRRSSAVDPIPRSALTDPELDRVHELERQDPDDVPAALLALATRAVLLSEDEALLEAVYGEVGPSRDLRRWVQHLKAGGDASELAALLDQGHATGFIKPVGQRTAIVDGVPADGASRTLVVWSSKSLRSSSGRSAR